MGLTTPDQSKLESNGNEGCDSTHNRTPELDTSLINRLI